MDDVVALAKDLARPFEGLHRVGADGLIYPYHDPVGFPTIGWGRLLSRVPYEALSKFPAITREEADIFFAQDMAKAYRSVRRLITTDLTIEQAAALADFAYNLGAGNLEISTLRRKLNRGDYAGAADEFPRWSMARGVKLPGLVKRRAAERNLFLEN